jgi:endonuclease/exonuclease/phosphatase family metal-dependent hydrolase
MASVISRHCLMFALLSLLLTSPQTSIGDGPTAVRVMSFNIRYGTARDGENHWDRRKEFLVDTIRTFNPDLLGTQETLPFQRDYLAEKLDEYDHAGVGRNDGREDGEMMALFYKRERFERVAVDHFWLSETPDNIGSKSWDSSLPRMVTWVKLQDRHRSGAAPLVYFNTHFDHLGVTARLESAKLLRRQIKILANHCSTIVTGDFNSAEGSPPYQSLFGTVGDDLSPIVDTYRVANTTKGVEEGTFSGFRPNANRGARIDWIGCSRDWHVRAADIDRTSKDGRTPSDHFPVTAVLVPGPSPK